MSDSIKEVNKHKIICGEIENIIKNIKSDTIDNIVTDPPYNIKIADWDNFNNIKEVLDGFYRVLKKSGSLFLFTGWSLEPEVRKIAKESGFILNDVITWDRIKGRGAKKRLVSTSENILWFVKSDKWTFNKELAYSTIKKKTGGLGLKNGKPNRALSNVWTDISPLVPWSKERVKHPTQKPLALINRILEVFTNPDDTILDGYGGSGTTLESCQIMGRKCIIVEKDINYINDLIIPRMEKHLKNIKL